VQSVITFCNYSERIQEDFLHFPEPQLLANVRTVMRERRTANKLLCELGLHLIKDNIVQRPLRHVVHTFTVAPVLDVSGGPDRLYHYGLGGFAEG